MLDGLTFKYSLLIPQFSLIIDLLALFSPKTRASCWFELQCCQRTGITGFREQQISWEYLKTGTRVYFENRVEFVYNHLFFSS